MWDVIELDFVTNNESHSEPTCHPIVGMVLQIPNRPLCRLSVFKQIMRCP